MSRIFLAPGMQNLSRTNASMSVVGDHEFAIDQHECHTRGKPVRGGEGGRGRGDRDGR